MTTLGRDDVNGWGVDVIRRAAYAWPGIYPAGTLYTRFVGIEWQEMCFFLWRGGGVGAGEWGCG